MSFFKDYPNRKDWRNWKDYAPSPSCEQHGGCPWCKSNREHSTLQRIAQLEASREDEWTGQA